MYQVEKQSSVRTCHRPPTWIHGCSCALRQGACTCSAHPTQQQPANAMLLLGVGSCRECEANSYCLPRRVKQGPTGNCTQMILISSATTILLLKASMARGGSSTANRRLLRPLLLIVVVVVVVEVPGLAGDGQCWLGRNLCPRLHAACGLG